ncbi:putative hydrolase/acyltransferase (alpha/beta hydrolase superfamily) [Handroanthus impetiginosus]|uniref:Putative hydrolase/acyltransferase (Alpha/beta hydrolase superfamily) n=1 Tax=Handroanthus impetiginosus TaxID=429701 RepID=A0A2G9H4T4_9LAMI|nr:putative hydrolase/acyltransferase (alpha/beta hydrolase superfamily) [Handroanthus impetiginosus]
MGNKFICMTKKESKNGGIGSKSKRGSMSKRRSSKEEELLHRQALAMAIQQHQLSQRFDNGSMSRRIGSTSSRRRPTNLSDPFSNTNNKKLSPEFLENIKTKKFVLVHGEGFGAWCWYKNIALLEESGLLPIALDLTGSGIDITDTNSVTTLADYSKPLIDFLQQLPEDEKVILVGHSSGGACISYALEHLHRKISKAIYLCATMISDGQRPFDVFAQELGSSELFSPESKSLIYGNGKDNPPTGFMFEKQHMQGLYFNQSPAKDVALAMVSMRPIPLGPIMGTLSLSTDKYGTGRRFYIQTLDDHALSPDVQEKLVRENPPEGVFKIKGSDHCPFFSKPQSLHKILIDIAQIP